MAQQFDYPKTETELRTLLDELYQQSKKAIDAGERPAFKGLLEIMSAETTIVTAIHNIKSNHGSDTPGVDNKSMKRDYLQKPYEWVINDIKGAFEKFEAQKVKRKYIDKPGKKEKRPLGVIRQIKCGLLPQIKNNFLRYAEALQSVLFATISAHCFM